MIVTGMPNLTYKLCELLNLDPKQIQKLNIEITPNKYVLVTATIYLGDMDIELTEALEVKKYEIRELV